jgi:hypothetical protein
VAAVERFGTRLAVVDVTRHAGIRVTLPSDDPRSDGGFRWTADVAAAGEYVVVLSSDRTSSVLRRYRIR